MNIASITDQLGSIVAAATLCVTIGGGLFRLATKLVLLIDAVERLQAAVDALEQKIDAAGKDREEALDTVHRRIDAVISARQEH